MCLTSATLATPRSTLLLLAPPCSYTRVDGDLGPVGTGRAYLFYHASKVPNPDTEPCLLEEPYRGPADAREDVAHVTKGGLAFASSWTSAECVMPPRGGRDVCTAASDVCAMCVTGCGCA